MATPKFENLVEMFERSIKLYGPRDLFGTKKNGQWVWTTYAQFGKQVDQFRGGLASLGIKRGDCVAIVSNNRVEWAVAAYACYGLGAALVPMYEAQLPKEWAFIINDCEAVAMIAATPEILKKVEEIQEKTPTLKHLIGLELPKSDPRSFEALLEAGEKNPTPAIKPEPKDTATLIYTSGTTGNPKGVILSHGNIASNISAVHEILPLEGEDRSLSFLPWAHSFGHTCELHAIFSLGGSMAICEAVDKIVANLAEVSPTVLMSVPRIFNRIYDGVNKQMAEKPAIIRNMFRSGIRVATKIRRNEPVGLLEKVTLKLADKIIFTKIRAKFGGRLKYAFSGGAALSKEVAEFIDGLGITVYEGYGLTETAPIATANRPGAHRIGSVGQPIPGVKVMIDKSAGHDGKQGEVIVAGPNIMQGYHRRDDENKAVFTEDRSFRTGDLGYLDDDGYLYITGRIKEQYKLENGKYVAPAPLEEQLKLSPYIANVMVYGDNRLYNVALVVVDMDSLKKWAEGQGLGSESPESLLKNSRVNELVMGEIEKYSAEFKGFEKIKRISLTAEDFTTANDMITPSLKVKRRVVWQKYGPQIEALYQDAASKEAQASAAS
ncbi:MAG: long-chain fatty acid--CoA ligase [Polyangiaceae bacterium]|nr:long-chain fatty acid--CoA ligase [Polyangiaceae bacterium]NUQ74739.1 long-chain fatty acid--CoA ligase [Polyangiaceae bacterium]